MKNGILLCLLLTVSAFCFCQQSKKIAASTKQDYLQKSKKQKTAAWILLGGGATLGFIGLTQFNFAGSDGEINNGSATVMFLTGTAAVITSIPFFSAAKKNKKKATSMSFKMERAPALQNQAFVYHSYPALSFNIAIQ